MIKLSKNKTILILTAQFGAGHISAANAIKNYILEKENNYNIIIENFIDASIPRMNKPMVKLYENNTKYTPGLYNYYYYLKKSFDPRHDVAHKIYTPKLTKYILEVKPDLIISTFPLAAACVYNLKTKYPDIKIPTLTVITDVVDSLEWVYPGTDMYFVPSSEIKNRFVQKGINPSSVRVTGVPISNKFYIDEKESISGKYRLLLVGGGRGLFDIEEEFIYWIDNFIDKHKDKIEVSIVTGKNEKLYKTFTEKKPFKNITVLGYINDMHNLIKKFDLILTKPGGATLFESIYSQTPILVKMPKIGQEIENSKFIIDKGIGFVYDEEKELESIFKALPTGEFDSHIDFMQENIKEFKKSIFPINIYEHISELINNKS